MELKVRRVVTGHDADGRAIVTHDALTDNAVSRRPGQQGVVLWTTDTSPADNTGNGDAGRRPVETTLPTGTVFRIVEYQPGNIGRMHRTDSIDYGIVMSGSVYMELDDGVEVHLKAGDVVVQRGTNHSWVNRGAEPCRIAFILVSAEPVKIGSTVLQAHG
jgi:quercetin dioxygenase-like cupin family protein